VTTAGSFLDPFSLALSANPWGIVAGPGRTLRFTEADANEIGRILQ
jgi:hypothetical protein